METPPVQFCTSADGTRIAFMDTGEGNPLLAQLNAELVGRPYLLVGVGRWGSADPWLGIPVTWEQISGARVIVEAGFEDFKVTPSQGTHFFQNLTSFEVGYFTVNPDVADGFVARNVKQLNLRESEEMREDRDYLEKICDRLEHEGLQAECILAGGNPAGEIAEAAVREGCDLIAMSTHGHRFLQDLLYGSVANEVRHISRIPVLLVRGERRPSGPREAVTRDTGIPNTPPSGGTS